jgi:hypothetical protein
MRRTLLLASVVSVTMPSLGPVPAVAVAAPVVAAVAAPVDTCVVDGRGVVDKGIVVWSAREGGVPVAQFASQEVVLSVSEWPVETAGRARVRIGKAAGAVRLEGWVEATKIPISARRDLPVVAGHVSVARGQPLDLRGARGGKLAVSTSIFATGQKVDALAACDAIAIGRQRVENGSIPDAAARFVSKEATLALFDAAAGKQIHELRLPGPKSGLLFWSTERSGGFVRIKHGPPLVIDAWAREEALAPFPKGELLDSVAPSVIVTTSAPQLKVEGSTKTIKVARDSPLRLAAEPTAKPIGIVEEGAELIVVDTVAEWSRIFPKGLELVPPDGKDFWVRTRDVAP